MKYLSSIIAYASIFATSVMAQSIPAGSFVQIHSAQSPDSDLCLGAVAGSQQAEILLEPCSHDLTTFNITNDTPPSATKIQIPRGATEPGQPPFLCITAMYSEAGNTPVVLQICEDDKFENWRFNAGVGTGEIVSTAPTATNVCLTAVGSNQGDPVEFRNCTGAASQQWTTAVAK